MYLCGTGVGKDYAEAFRWFQKSALQGNPGGEYMLGNMYSSGEGVERNDKEAIRWYHKAIPMPGRIWTGCLNACAVNHSRKRNARKAAHHPQEKGRAQPPEPCLR